MANPVVGFDKWCRIKSGLSNKTIANAISVDGKVFTEATVQRWRRGETIPDPYVTLAPLRFALKGPWPTVTAEETWQDLLQVIAAAAHLPTVILEDEPAENVIEVTSTPTPKKSEPAVPKTYPELDALKIEMDQATDLLGPAVTAAEQVSLGWFSRTSEKFKKYVTKRDLKHRKAYLGYSLSRGRATLEKNRGKRVDLDAAMKRLKTAIDAFEAMKAQCSNKLGKKIDENLGLWRELQKAQPLLARAQQAFDKASNKHLPGLDEAIKRVETFLADWDSKSQAISEEACVTLSWLTKPSALADRLEHRWQKNRVETADGFDWPQDFDPFEAQCVCKDKLADAYKVGEQFNGKNPVEIDIACEIDLTVAGLELRQKMARQLCLKP